MCEKRRDLNDYLHENKWEQYARGCVWKILWMGIKWSHWQYLQDSNPNLRQKIISKILRTRASNLIVGDITNIAPIAICDGLGIWKNQSSRFGWNYKKKSVTTKWRSSCSRFCCKQNSVFCYFEVLFTPWIQLWLYLCKLVGISNWHISYIFFSTGISVFPQIGQFAVFLLPLKEEKQIDRFEYWACWTIIVGILHYSLSLLCIRKWLMYQKMAERDRFQLNIHRVHSQCHSVISHSVP